MRLVFAILFCAVFEVRPLPRAEDPLEPSVQNEVDHAVSLAESWLSRQTCTNAVPTEDLFKTNGIAREQIAIKLISSQRGGGWWLTETNAAPTRLAVKILKSL